MRIEDKWNGIWRRMMEMIGKRMGDDWLVRSIGLDGVAGDRTAGNET